MSRDAEKSGVNTEELEKQASETAAATASQPDVKDAAQASDSLGPAPGDDLAAGIASIDLERGQNQADISLENAQTETANSAHSENFSSTDHADGSTSAEPASGDRSLQEATLFQKYLEERNAQEDDQPTLADKIMEKIIEKNEAQEAGNGQGSRSDEGVMLPEKVIQVYTQVGELLARYRSGKLPKAFKIIPTLQNWEDVLYVTQPESWSTQAVYEATVVFMSTLPAKECQVYVNDVLLARFKAELDPLLPTKPGSGPKTLSPHIYRALKKSLYKPAAFFKGFLLPLAESGSCTLREATIASSVLAKTSVPALHSAAALLRLAEYEHYSPPISVFLKTLLEKKYALPYKVVDSLVWHFSRFRVTKAESKKGSSKLPVLWHQTVLAFAVAYKNDITDEQRDLLFELLKTQTHAAITPEIRRELLSGHARSEETVSTR